MSTRRPITAGRERPTNLAVLMREAFVALNDVVIARLTERGHAEVRSAHGAVFQYLDDTGTTVSVLADTRPDDETGHGGTGSSPGDPRLRRPGTRPGGPPGKTRQADRSWARGDHHRPGTGARTRGTRHQRAGRRPRAGPTPRPRSHPNRSGSPGAVTSARGRFGSRGDAGDG